MVIDFLKVTFRVEQDTPAVIVLSRLDDRHFQELSGCFQWSLDFVVYKQGCDKPIGRSVHERYWRRSVNLEINLESGDYVVHVRIDREQKVNAHTELYHVKHSRKEASGKKQGIFRRDSTEERSISVVYRQSATWNTRKHGKKWAGACDSRSIARNFKPERYGDVIPYGNVPIGEDLTKIETLTQTNTNGDTVKHSSQKDSEGTRSGNISDHRPGQDYPIHQVQMADPEYTADLHSGGKLQFQMTDETYHGFSCYNCKTSPIIGSFHHCMDSECSGINLCQSCVDNFGHPTAHMKLKVCSIADANKLKDNIRGRTTHPEDYEVTLGLRVYTKETPAVIKGQLRHGSVLRGSRRVREER